MVGAATLIIAISCLAARLPAVSIMYAAFNTNQRAWSIMMRDSAIRSSVTPCSDKGLPKATRDCARRHNSSNALSATPMRRMQW